MQISWVMIVSVSEVHERRETHSYALGVDSPSLPGSKYLHCPSGASTSRLSHLSPPPISFLSAASSQLTHAFHSIIFPTTPCSALASSMTCSTIPPNSLSTFFTSVPADSTSLSRWFVIASVAWR